MRNITINERNFSVRNNLYAFLKTWSSYIHESYIWVDQICIDQETVLERNHQVTMMAEIYHTASEVMVWLGDADLRPQDGNPTKIAARLNMIDTDP
jgi:hypothetical protein